MLVSWFYASPAGVLLSINILTRVNGGKRYKERENGSSIKLREKEREN